MFRALGTRIFIAILAFFGLTHWADTAALDPHWRWSDITRQPFSEWVRQVPVQLPVKLAQGLQIPVEMAVAHLSQDTMPWYVRLPAKTIGSAALYALLVRLMIARLRARFGLPPAAER